MAGPDLGKVAKRLKERSGTPATEADGKKTIIPKKAAKPPEENWRFSFACFTQIDKFGLNGEGIANNWLVSVLERLKQLSMERIDNIVGNKLNSDANRYHEINWSGTNVPITIEELITVPKHYRDNQEEFPIEQIMLSMGTGRLVGFFDENWVFNLVLLDPLHNLQPAKRFDYVVRSSSPLNCQLTQLQFSVREGLQLCSQQECTASARINEALSERSYSEQYGVILVKFEDQSDIVEAKKFIQAGYFTSYHEIFMHGLYQKIEEIGSTAPSAAPAVPAQPASP